MTIVLLLRHGENEWVKEHRLAGWTPGVHLNDNGHGQARAAAERTAALPVKAIYTSPLVRCVETARYVAEQHDLPLVELPEIGEVKYGEWEGQPIKELAKEKAWHAVQHFPSRFAFPGGESLRNVQRRAVDQIEALAAQHADETIVVASHADVIKLVLAFYLGVHIDLFQRITVSPASISVLALHGSGARVIRINDDGPLQPPPPRQTSEPDNDKREDEASTADTTATE